ALASASALAAARTAVLVRAQTIANLRGGRTVAGTAALASKLWCRDASRYSWRPTRRAGEDAVTEEWTNARQLGALERMLLIRRFEECLVHLFEQKAFMAHYHLYIGQEATGVAVTECLGANDKLATTHRNHGHVLARGADPARALAEILCRTT